MNLRSAALRLTAWLMIAAVTWSCRAWPDEDDSRQLDRLFPRGALQIATPDARIHPFQVWIAQDDAHRARGLMHVRQLPADAGMLFVYDRPQPVSMWMKNTYIPLDMLFVRADGRVANVVENTTPMSLDTISSNGDVLAVIELNAGTAARLKIRSGAQVIHSTFSGR